MKLRNMSAHVTEEKNITIELESGEVRPRGGELIMRSHPVYYAEYCPYGVRAFSDCNTLYAFSSPLKRMHWVEENEATRQEITAKQARRWYGTKEMAIAKENVDVAI